MEASLTIWACLGDGLGLLWFIVDSCIVGWIVLFWVNRNRVFVQDSCFVIAQWELLVKVKLS